jgi:hypothetical protein
MSRSRGRTTLFGAFALLAASASACAALERHNLELERGEVVGAASTPWSCPENRITVTKLVSPPPPAPPPDVAADPQRLAIWQKIVWWDWDDYAVSGCGKSGLVRCIFDPMLGEGYGGVGCSSPEPWEPGRTVAPYNVRAMRSHGLTDDGRAAPVSDVPSPAPAATPASSSSPPPAAASPNPPATAPSPTPTAQ